MGDTVKNKSEAPVQNWWKGLKAEFKKVSWTDRKSLVKQTAAVTVISIVLGLIITFLDALLQYGINFLIG